MSFEAYEAFERMAFYGIASNLVVYLTTQLHEDTVSSVRNVNNWSGVVWMTPIIGAYLADAYLGRFWTFSISSLIYVLVMFQYASSHKSPLKWELRTKQKKGGLGWFKFSLIHYHIHTCSHHMLKSSILLSATYALSGIH